MTRFNIKGVMCIFIGLCLNSYVYAQSPIYSTTLNNGLKVIIKEDHRAPLVNVQVWYAVGGADEPKDKLGISHVLEHMMFKGTVRVPDNELKRLNATYGGSLNAITTPNHTYYYQNYPKDYLGLALELEADRMSGLYLKQRDFMTEIKVVMEERRQRIDDNPQALAFEKFRYAAYPQSGYQNPVIGSMSTLNNIELKDLQQWYDLWYAPNNATIVIVGDVQTTNALRQVQRYFGDLRGKKLPAREPLTHPTHLGYKHVEIDTKTEVANLYMAWNVPSAITTKNPKDIYSLSLLQNILNGQASSRLNRILVKEQKKLAAINVSYDMLQRGDTLFIITAIPQPNVSLKQAQHAILEVLTQLEKDINIDAELDRVRNRIIADLIYNQDTLSGQAQLLGTVSTAQLLPSFLNTLNQQYQTIQLNDIQQVLKRYFTTSNLTTLYMQSEKHRALNDPEEHMPETDNETPPTVPDTLTVEGQ